jgi:hypothetical protein
LQKTREAQVPGFTQHSLAGACDEIQGVILEGMMSELDTIKLAEDELLDVIGREAVDDCGERHAGPQIFIDPQGHVLQQLWLGHQDQVVIFGKIGEQEP